MATNHSEHHSTVHPYSLTAPYLNQPPFWQTVGMITFAFAGFGTVYFYAYHPSTVFYLLAALGLTAKILTSPFPKAWLSPRQSIRKEVEQHSLVREKDSTRQPPKAQTSAATVVPLSPADEVWLQRIKQLTQESLTQKTFSVEELADVAFLSPRQLRRKVKALTGIAPSKFIREIQLEVARQKLEEGLIPTLSEIAYTCGFEHQATFSRMFKTRYGLSPSQYVKRIMA